MSPSVGRLIVLLNVVWNDLRHSPAVSLVPTYSLFAEAFCRLVRLDKVRFKGSCSRRTGSTYSTFVPMLLQCWKQCGTAGRVGKILTRIT